MQDALRTPLQRTEGGNQTIQPNDIGSGKGESSKLRYRHGSVQAALAAAASVLIPSLPYSFSFSSPSFSFFSPFSPLSSSHCSFSCPSSSCFSSSMLSFLPSFFPHRLSLSFHSEGLPHNISTQQNLEQQQGLDASSTPRASQNLPCPSLDTMLGSAVTRPTWTLPGRLGAVLSSIWLIDISGPLSIVQVYATVLELEGREDQRQDCGLGAAQFWVSSAQGCRGLQFMLATLCMSVSWWGTSCRFS